MLGYEGYAVVDGAYFLCTSMSVPKNEVRIDSGGSWGGTDATSRLGINVPRIYDYPTYEGSFDYEISSSMFVVMRDWLFSRSTAKQIYLYPTRGSLQRYDECIFNTMSFSSSSGSSCTGSCSFIALNCDELLVGSDYINNKYGAIQDGGLVDLVSPFLNPGCANKDPIPYWKGYIESLTLLPLNAELLSWTLNVTQQVEKYYSCKGIGLEPNPPDYIGLGPLTVVLDLEIIVTSSVVTVPDEIDSVNLVMDEEIVLLKDLEIQSFEQGLKSNDDITSYTISYQIFDMEEYVPVP